MRIGEVSNLMRLRTRCEWPGCTLACRSLIVLDVHRLLPPSLLRLADKSRHFMERFNTQFPVPKPISTHTQKAKVRPRNSNNASCAQGCDTCAVRDCVRAAVP